jgi:hypothetical protein
MRLHNEKPSPIYKDPLFDVALIAIRLTREGFGYLDPDLLVVQKLLAQCHPELKEDYLDGLIDVEDAVIAYKAGKAVNA